jgi:drug/metabolite transporter (DMT)-like permease
VVTRRGAGYGDERLSKERWRGGLGLAAVAVAAAAFSWGFPLVKLLGLPGATIASARVVIGAAALLVAAPILRAPWPSSWGAVIAAGLFFGVHQLLYIAATQRTSIAIVTVIGALQPLMVALVSRQAVGEKVPRAFALWALLAAAGIALVVGGSYRDQSRSLTGDLIAVVNLCSYVGYFLASKRARLDGAPTLTLTACSLAIAAVVVVPAMLISGPVMPAAWQWGYIALLALGPGNGHLLVNWAHKSVSGTLASLTLSVVPLLASLWAALLFGEPIGLAHIGGMALVAIAIEGGRRSEAAAAQASAH